MRDRDIAQVAEELNLVSYMTGLLISHYLPRHGVMVMGQQYSQRVH